MQTNKRVSEFYLIGFAIACIMVFAQSCAEVAPMRQDYPEPRFLPPYKCQNESNGGHKVIRCLKR